MTEVPSGILVVDKPQGWTSHQVVSRVRRLCGTRKVGHAGTLDPMATGILLVGVERATRLLGHLALHDKRYQATIRLGQATITDDAEGDVTTASGSGGLDVASVTAAVGNFVGEISQVPSAVSAIKVDGRRSYARVRAGEEVKLAARPVTVSRFDVLAALTASAPGPDGAPLPVLDVLVDVECSSGTYVRALARDLGEQLGVGGHLTALRRTRIGPFGLADLSIGADELAAGAGSPRLLSMAEAARRSFPVVEVGPDTAAAILVGRPLGLQLSGLTGLILEGGDLLALYRPGEEEWAVPEAVFGRREDHPEWVVGKADS